MYECHPSFHHQVLAAPGTVKTYKNFNAELYVLTQDEGGRHTPIFNNYRPQVRRKMGSAGGGMDVEVLNGRGPWFALSVCQFYVRTSDVTGSITLPEGKEMVRDSHLTDGLIQLGAELHDNLRANLMVFVTNVNTCRWCQVTMSP